MPSLQRAHRLRPRKFDILVSAAAYLHAELHPHLPAVRAAITFHPVSASAATGIFEDALDVPISLAGVVAP